MKILHYMLTSIFIFLFSTNIQAELLNKKTDCPTILSIYRISTLLKKQDIQRNNDLYIAQISGLEINGQVWSILSHNIIAKNVDEALLVAKKHAENVTNKVYSTTRQLFKDKNVCLYYDRTTRDPFVTIMAFLEDIHT